MQNPRIKKNCGFKGVEPHIGCFNTGLAWKIHRSCLQPSLYIVCQDNDLDDVRKMICHSPYFPKWKQRIIRLPNGRIAYLFKTSKAAWKKFHEQNNIFIEAQRQQAKKVIELRDKANKGDIGAALELGDY